MTTLGNRSVFSSADARKAWLKDLETQTALHRERKAARLTARAKAIGLARRKANVTDGTVARSETGQVRGVAWESSWHLARAKGARTLFERVANCGDPEGYRVDLACRGCGEKKTMLVGCDQVTFCAPCRDRAIAQNRVLLTAKFAGVYDKARRVGLLRSSRRHHVGGRFGLRMLTLTAPHVGLPGDRVAAMYRVWPRFARLLRDELRAWLAPEKTDCWLEGKDGELVQQTLWDFVQHDRESEWTSGDDGFGHPHFHVLLFSPYIEQELLSRLWTRAYNDVHGTNYERLIVDVRFRQGDLHAMINEACKYMVKDWELQAGRVASDVMAQVYVAYDGRRRRQSSAGLKRFALAIVKACPCCGHESERGHWARVKVNHSVSEALNGPRLPWSQGPPLPRDDDEADLSVAEWMARRAAQRHHDEWLATPAGAALRRWAGLAPLRHDEVAVIALQANPHRGGVVLSADACPASHAPAPDAKQVQRVEKVQLQIVYTEPVD